MAFRLVVLDERPGVRPVGIRERIRWALSKLIIWEAGDKAKTVCRNLQLCAGLEAGIEGETHTMGQRQRERAVRRRREDYTVVETEGEEEEKIGDRLRVEKKVIEEDIVVNL